MARKKENPSVETVQQKVKATDLLLYEVCTPIKVRLDDIEICSPSIVVCAPNELGCRPFNPWMTDDSMMPRCRPFCPSFRPTNLLRQRLLASDLERLNAEVEKLKKEIETLKRKR